MCVFNRPCNPSLVLFSENREVFHFFSEAFNGKHLCTGGCVRPTRQSTDSSHLVCRLEGSFGVPLSLQLRLALLWRALPVTLSPSMLAVAFQCRSHFWQRHSWLPLAIYLATNLAPFAHLNGLVRFLLFFLFLIFLALRGENTFLVLVLVAALGDSSANERKEGRH